MLAAARCVANALVYSSIRQPGRVRAAALQGTRTGLSSSTQVNKRYATTKLSCGYAHVGLYDVRDQRIWIARKRFGVSPETIAHARMLRGGTNTTSVADKDRFICYWFNPPNTGEGLVHGERLDWAQGHLMVRLDPHWDFVHQALIRSNEAVKLDRNVDQQFRWGRLIFDAYRQMRPEFPLSYHMVGPRPRDSVFGVSTWPGGETAPEPRPETEGPGGIHLPH